MQNLLNCVISVNLFKGEPAEEKTQERANALVSFPISVHLKYWFPMKTTGI